MTYDEAARERWVAEPEKVAERPERSAFARDRARVLHAASLRRLAGKTQVIEVGGVDVPRTRLTHSLECAQIGREMAAALGSDPDLVETACLAHDLGHPPFGHNGERVLDEIASSTGGFEGNAQSLRLLTRLEVKVPGAGLNLTRATLDASCKYAWPRREAGGKFGVYGDDRPVFDWFRRGAPGVRQCLETQTMDWADDVAYSVHDFEDGVHAGRIDPSRVDAAAVADAVRAWYGLEVADAEVAAALRRLRGLACWVERYDATPGSAAALKAMTSELIGRFSGAAIDATRAAHGTGPLARYDADLVVPSDVLLEAVALKAITVHYVVRPQQDVRERQREVLTDLVRLVSAHAPEALDPLLRPAYRGAVDDAARLRVVVDQIAGYTDVGAVAVRDQLAARTASRGSRTRTSVITAASPTPGSRGGDMDTTQPDVPQGGVGSAPALDAVSSRRASLRSAMNAVEGAIAAPALGRVEPWRAAVVEALRHLSDQFEDHVATTEGPDGFHDDLVREAPRLAYAVRALAVDHGVCGEALQHTLRAAEQAADEVSVERVRELATDLLARLSKHRQRGAELIYEAYEFDLGTGD